MKSNILFWNLKNYRDLINTYSADEKNISLSVEHIDNFIDCYDSSIQKKSFFPWQRPFPLLRSGWRVPVRNDNDTIQFFYVIGTQNINYWKLKKTSSGKTSFDNWGFTTNRGKWIEDCEAMVYAHYISLKNGMPLLDPEYLKNISLKTVKKIYRNTNIPMIETRQKKYRDTGEGLLKFGLRYNTPPHFSSILKKSNGNLLSILKYLSMFLPGSYGDPFAKLSLLATKMIYDRRAEQMKKNNLNPLESDDEYQGLTRIKNPEYFQAQPDYMIPFFMLRAGLWKISDSFLQKLVNKKRIPASSPLELEIRAATVKTIQVLSKKWVEKNSITDKKKQAETRLAFDSIIWKTAVGKCLYHRRGRWTGKECPFGEICSANHNPLLLKTLPHLTRTPWY